MGTVLDICTDLNIGIFLYSVAEPVELKLFENWSRSRNYLFYIYLLRSVLRMFGWRKTWLRPISFGTTVIVQFLVAIYLSQEPEPKINNFCSATLLLYNQLCGSELTFCQLASSSYRDTKTCKHKFDLLNF